MKILEKAISFSIEKHSGMFRKSSNIPFIIHPMEAMSIAAGLTSDYEILAATVLHDVVEDTPVRIEEIKELFGERIASLVASDTEDKMRDIPPSESWMARKEATIIALKSASIDEKIIVLSDKLSNIRSIYQNVIHDGDAIWEKFNQKDKRLHEWYYRAIAENISELSDTIAYHEYCRLVNEVFNT